MGYLTKINHDRHSVLTLILEYAGDAYELAHYLELGIELHKEKYNSPAGEDPVKLLKDLKQAGEENSP